MAASKNKLLSVTGSSLSGTADQFIWIKDIVPPTYVERMHIDKDSIQELAENIKQNGLINPLVVKKVGNKYEIIAGHRRFLALKQTDAEKAKAVIVKGNMLETELIKLSENLMREDLSDVEEAAMLERLSKRGGMDEKRLAKMIGKSEGYVRQKLQINKYPEELIQALSKREVNFSVCRELVRLKNKDLMIEYLRHAKSGGATPNLVKMWVDDIIEGEKRDKLKQPVVTNKGGTAAQTQPMYICVACSKGATIQDSSLHRIHHECFKELEAGG